MDENNNKGEECPICKARLNHPAIKLPCSHNFCFLCVKGFPTSCALCRAEIDPEYFDNPVLFKLIPDNTIDLDFQWYYSGDKDWWKYDKRSNIELETAFNAGDPECNLELSGRYYRINFQTMVQMRNGDVTKRRKVKRGTPSLPAKGIAGIKQNKETQLEVIVGENEFNEADTIPLYSNNNEARAIETDVHHMFRGLY